MSATDIAGLLLADPTFSLMSPAERRGEALELMKTAGLGDDPLDAALAVEEAEGRALAGDIPDPGVPAPVAAGIEPCREKWGEGCTQPLSGTGRCMTCGAQRVSAETVSTLEAVGELAKTPDVSAHLPAAAPEPFPSPPGYRVPEPGFLARFKAATGNNDRQIGDLLGLARSSVQAIVGGRVGENLTPAMLEQLAEALEAQTASLARLRAEIGV